MFTPWLEDSLKAANPDTLKVCVRTAGGGRQCRPWSGLATGSRRSPDQLWKATDEPLQWNIAVVEWSRAVEGRRFSGNFQALPPPAARIPSLWHWL
jgi:hypothetical protein